MVMNTFQAFPIRENTYVGTPTALSTKNYNIIHLQGDATVTVSFGTTDIVVDALEGSDLVISGSDTITSTAAIIMS